MKKNLNPEPDLNVKTELFSAKDEVDAEGETA